MPKEIYIKSEEIRKKLSEARRGKHHTEETKRKLSEALKGKHLTEEQINKDQFF